MNISLKHIISKYLLFILAIQILNISVDAIDFHPIYNPHSTANSDFNDINSAVEYISEIVLGYKDAFPEIQKQGEQKNTQSIKHNVIKIYEPKPFHFSVDQQFITVVSFVYPLDEKYSFLFSKDVTPPPPKEA
ncbi:hypothetical protein ACFOW1_10885 [Parasediminibacterium paludis]|uniref:DUF3887 domain-containing protein n=1 Tax=Parasediminibacterium paludis TaxID=908966 RepID=A0ABV8PXX0_9BACT